MRQGLLSQFATGPLGECPARPQAVIEEPDGSTVFVQTSAIKAGHDAAEAMTREQVGAIAIAIAIAREKAWQG